MESNLKIYTSSITKENIDNSISKNLLPLFIPRNLIGNDLVGKYSGSAIHLRMLSPSGSLWWKRKSGEIDFETFSKNYMIELSSLNFQTIIKKLESLSEVSNADGVVLFDFDETPSESCRFILSELFNKSGILTKTVEEL